MKNVSIRESQSGDLDTLWSIYQQSITPTLPKSLFQDNIRTGVTYVYEELDRFLGNPEIKGFVTSFIDLGDPWIWCICTHQRFRGQGVGTALIKQTEKRWMWDCDYIKLYVNADNPAQKLYFDLGYRIKKVEKDLYPTKDGWADPGLLMVKKLN